MSRKIILDSGAFTVSKSKTKKEIDIDAYIEFVKKNDDIFDHCINLDYIPRSDEKNKNIDTAKLSYQNWQYIRSKGIDVMPVFHLGSDEKWLQKYLKQTDYIGIGAVAQLNTDQRIRGLNNIWEKYLTDTNKKPIAKFHGLGLTAIDLLFRYPWYSVDSTSPVISSAFGQIYMPKLLDGKFTYFGMKTIKVSDQAKHVVGAKTFLNLPSIYKKEYTKLFEKHGFLLGEIANQPVKQKRTIKLRRPEPPPILDGMDLTKPADSKIKTLANNHMLRYRWNLIVWGNLIDRLPKYTREFTPGTYPKEELTDPHERTNIYVVCSTNAYLENTFATKHPFNILTSYVYMSETLLKLLSKQLDYEKTN